MQFETTRDMTKYLLELLKFFNVLLLSVDKNVEEIELWCTIGENLK